MTSLILVPMECLRIWYFRSQFLRVQFLQGCHHMKRHPFYFLSVIDTYAYKIHVCYCYKYLKPNAWKTREKFVCANFAVLLSISLYRFSIFFFPYRESIMVVSECPICLCTLLFSPLVSLSSPPPPPLPFCYYMELKKHHATEVSKKENILVKCRA